MEKVNKETCSKCEGTKCTCNKTIDKPLEEKTLIERHMMSDGKFNVGSCLMELEAINKDLIIKVAGLEDAMAFFVDWYNRTQRVDILVPDNKIILPNG